MSVLTLRVRLRATVLVRWGVMNEHKRAYGCTCTHSQECRGDLPCEVLESGHPCRRPTRTRVSELKVE
jgi:hypothetical protein